MQLTLRANEKLMYKKIYEEYDGCHGSVRL